MPSPSLAILIVTARTVTVELAGTGALDRLKAPLDFILSEGGETVTEGVLERPVLTLEDLVPGTDYTLVVGDLAPLAFTTSGESAFVDIRDYGADPEAGENTQAIMAAIAVAPPGATVFVPPGLWHTGPLTLKSDLFLYLPKGATLMGLADRSAYPILSAFDDDGRQQASWEGVPADCYASLIGGRDAERLVIAGKGTLDGAGAQGDWWSWPKETRQGARRPRTVFLNRCSQSALAGITVKNSPSWTIHPIDCTDLVFADLLVENPSDSPNTDGLNPESSQVVTIVGVRFSVGDDCIAIKAGKRWPDGHVPAPTRHVIIRHCLLERGHGGVVIGSEMSGSVTDVGISHCRFVDTDRGLRIKTRRGRGGEVARIALADCMMDGVETPLVVNGFYFCDPDGKSDAVQNRAPGPVSETTPHIRDISFARVAAHNVHHAAAYVLGLTEAPVTGLSIRDFTVSYAPHAVAAPPAMAVGVPALRHGAIVVENAVAPHIEGVVLPRAAAREAV